MRLVMICNLTVFQLQYMISHTGNMASLSISLRWLRPWYTRWVVLFRWYLRQAQMLFGPNELACNNRHPMKLSNCPLSLGSFKGTHLSTLSCGTLVVLMSFLSELVALYTCPPWATQSAGPNWVWAYRTSLRKVEFASSHDLQLNCVSVSVYDITYG